MLAVYLLEAGDRPGGQVPDGVEHVSGVDPVVICTFATETAFSDTPIRRTKLSAGVSVTLTGNVPVATFQGTEVRHELPNGDFEDFEQTRVLEKGVCHLWRHKPASVTAHTEHVSVPGDAAATRAGGGRGGAAVLT